MMKALPKLQSIARVFPVALGALWLVVIGVGWYWLALHTSRSGELGRTSRLPQQWCDEHDPSRIFVFLHPRCPCSRATVEQLHRVVSNHKDQTPLTAFLFCPQDEELNWVETGVWRSLRRLPCVQLLVDVDGAAARQFGVATSGHVLVYHETDRPAFSGGITPSRGHQGECVGVEHLRRALRGESGVESIFPVYGCGFYEDL